MKNLLIKLILLFCFAGTLPLFGQTRIAHHANHIAVDVANNGALLFRQSSSVLQATWPYESRYFSTSGRKNYQESWGVWMAAKDFVGVGDSIPAYKHIAAGNFYVNSTDITEKALEKTLRDTVSTIIVSDGSDQRGESKENANINPSLDCDEQIYCVFRTTMGLTVELKTYAYAIDDHLDYIIYDYKFVNQGITDTSDVRQLNATLKKVWLGVSFSTDIKPKFGGKDQDDYYKYYGSSYEDYVNGDITADSARILYVWDGHEGYGTYEPDPITMEPQNPGYYAIGFLHVDRQAIDDLESGSSDGPTQPATIQTVSALEASATEQYQKMSVGEKVDTSGFGAENYLMACGPYDIPLGEDVRIVLVQIISGISRFQAKDLGVQLSAGDITQEEYEQTVATAKDSIFKAYHHAKIAFDHKLNLPDPPQPPDSLTITSGIMNIKLEWSNEVEEQGDRDTGINDFAGYRVYRAAISPENAWEKVFECGGNTGVPVTNTYIDTNLIVGFKYFYAVTAYDDGSQNELYPGKSLESSRQTSNAYIGAEASLAPQNNKKDFSENLRVVPNPYNIRSRNYGDPTDPGDTENNKILFVGIPGKCKIRIYTVAGDLVKTIHHDSGLGSEPWHLLSDSDQLIVSGLYIASIESDYGNEIIKFVVIR